MSSIAKSPRFPMSSASENASDQETNLLWSDSLTKSIYRTVDSSNSTSSQSFTSDETQDHWSSCCGSALLCFSLIFPSCSHVGILSANPAMICSPILKDLRPVPAFGLGYVGQIGLGSVVLREDLGCLRSQYSLEQEREFVLKVGRSWFKTGTNRYIKWRVFACVRSFFFNLFRLATALQNVSFPQKWHAWRHVLDCSNLLPKGFIEMPIFGEPQALNNFRISKHKMQRYKLACNKNNDKVNGIQS